MAHGTVGDHWWPVLHCSFKQSCTWSIYRHPLTSCLRLQDPEGKPKKANIRDNRDGTYTVSYVPDMTGRYTITIKYGGDEIPYSPYRIHALPTGDASKCLVTGQAPPITPPATNQIISPETVTASLTLLLFSRSVDRRTRTGWVRLFSTALMIRAAWLHW